jgi:carbonic anhydrase/acetyltransferase-like protein (isoleucine patch superfamily)
MAHIVELDGVTPTIGKDVYLAPTAVLVGDVRIGDQANVWFGAVLRADSERIEVGARSSIQDNVVIHCADGLPTIVGEVVTVGHASERWSETAAEKYQQLRERYLRTSTARSWDGSSTG